MGAFDLEEGKQCHYSHQRLARCLVSLLLCAEPRAGSANKPEWMRRNFIADKFLLWLAQCRSDVSVILSTRNLHAPLANVKQPQADYTDHLPPAPHLDLVYFWPLCLSDATIQTIVAILWSTITIYCDDGVRRVSLAHTCSSGDSTVSTRSLSCALSIAWSPLSIKLFQLPNRSSDWLASFIHSFVH